MQENLHIKNYTDIPKNILDKRLGKINYILFIIIFILSVFVIGGYLYVSNIKSSSKVTIISANSPKSTAKGDSYQGTESMYFVGDTNSNCIIPAATKITHPLIPTHMIKDGKVYMGEIMLIEGADPQTYREMEEPFFSRDKNMIYYMGKPIVGIDVTSYQMISDHIGMDKNSVYYNGYKIKDIDRESFKLIEDSDFAIDKNSVYQNGELRKINIDRSTFKALGGSYYEDNSGVYYNDGTRSRMENVDVQTFRMVGKYLAKDKNNVYSGRQILKDFDSKTLEFIGGLFSKDRNNVYFGKKIVVGADKNTFKYIGEMYAKDKNNIYLGEKVISVSDPQTFCAVNNSFDMNLAKDSKSIYASEMIPNSDANSFIFLSFSYQKDKNNAYYNMKKIQDADPISFEVIDSVYAKDNKAVYFNGKIVEEADPKTFTTSRDLKGYWGQDSRSKYLNGKLYTAESEKSQYKSFDFSVSPCDKTISPYKSDSLGVKEADWKNDVLTIKAFVSINCSSNVSNGKFDISDEKVYLSYKVETSENLARCNCAHQLTWKIEGLDKKDYTFEIKQQ